MKCPSCGNELEAGSKTCVKCGTGVDFPGTLYLLSIFLGLIGGIIGALIAAKVYQSSWWKLIAVGILMTFCWYGVYFVYFASR